MNGVRDTGPAVLARELAKSYGERVAVGGIDFQVPAGICFGFLGPNGAGKTTTMKMIYGLATVGDGELRVLGMDARTERRQIKARIGVVPQETNLDGDLGTVAAGVLIIVAAPISEEIFFRGFLFGGFRRRLSFPLAALISAVNFGLFHYTGASSIAVVPQLAFLGFLLCAVYEETGSIYPTIALHMLNNTLAFIVLTS